MTQGSLARTGASLNPSGRGNPCPICRRDGDGDCRVTPELILCYRGTTHHPPEGLRPGEVRTYSDNRQWAYTGESADGRCAVFTLDKPRNGSRPQLRAVAPVAPAPQPAPITLAQLPEPGEIPPAHWPDGHLLPYGEAQQVKVAVSAKGKQFIPQHRVDGRWKNGAGPDPWPLWREEEVLRHGPGRWVLVAEGEKCANWARAAGCVATSPPGHGRSVEKMTPQLARLAEAGVKGIVYLADHDKGGSTQAGTLATACAAAHLPVRIIHAADVWPDIPAGGSIDDAPGTPQERVAAVLAAAAAPQPPAAAPKPVAQPQQPFTVLGTDPGNDPGVVWCRLRDGGIQRFRATRQGELLGLAPIQYWESLWPGARDGVNWQGAQSDLIHNQAAAAGVFRPHLMRGRGVWRDGDRIVWNTGAGLLVDGAPESFSWQSPEGNAYQPGQRLPIDPDGRVLTDAEGVALRRLLTELMPWSGANDGLLFLGHAVLAPVGGALDLRPALQVTARSQAGKSTLMLRSYLPLLGADSPSNELIVSRSHSTAAGIRQTLGADSLPVFIDESEEGESGNRRAQHIQLARASYDGIPISMGTPGAQRAISYVMRSTIALSGINAAIPNPADRSRFITVSPANHPERFRRFERERDQLLTPATGQALVRRTIRNLPALLAAIPPMTAALRGLPGGSGRLPETLAPLLAAARSLETTAPLDADGAIAWLDSVGWQGVSEEDVEAASGDREPYDCLAMLLGHAIQWHEPGSPRTARPVGELIGMTRLPNHGADAARSLANVGVKLDGQWLLVSNKTPVFTGSRWANQAHRDRLLGLPGATRCPDGRKDTTRIGSSSCRYVAIPMALIAGD